LLVVVVVVVAQVEPRELRDVKTEFAESLAAVGTST
jgi:hypothetical protein